LLIAAQAGSSYEKATSSFSPKAKFFPRIPELVAALNNAQIKALIIGTVEAGSLVKNNDNLSFFLVPGHDEKFGIALPKGSKHLKAINTVLAKFAKDGTIATLEKKYFKA
jgi:ABC-type amino acid transport substrate-binding protein